MRWTQIPATAEKAAPDVTVLSQEATQPWSLPSESVDVVFSSNFFEHLPTKQDFAHCLAEAYRVLRPQGLLIALGPNIRFCFDVYWDFVDHHLPLSDRSMVEALEIAGFRSGTRHPALPSFYHERPGASPGVPGSPVLAVSPGAAAMGKAVPGDGAKALAMSFRMSPQTARWIGWPACFTLVFVSAFFLSGTRQPPLELDPSWHAALEYATAHHLQFGTQIVFTFGPLGFLSTRTSLGHLLGARIAFAFFWSALVALTATALAKRLPGWVRYAFLAWLVVFTLSEGLDQTAFFVMAYGALLLLVDNPKQRWQAPFFVFAFIVLSLIKVSFLTAAIASLALVVVCWIRQRKILKAIVLALAAPAGFVACWMALGQSPSHLAPWFRHGLELESGYSAAMNLVPKTPVLCAALAALALFVGAFIATIVRARGGLLTWAVLITLAQYVFLAWKEGFTRSGDWHTFVFLWFLPLGLAFCFLGDLSSAPTASHRWVLDVTFAASMVLCLVAANFQIPGFAWQQVTDWPRRVTHNAKMIFATLRGRSDDLYADCRDSKNARMLLLDHAKDVIGNESVDVMNYLAVGRRGQ